MKEDIGPFFLTPDEIFAKTFPSITVRPDELTVISWILPQAESTKRDHRKETAYPSERWARARKYGEEFNAKLRKQLVELLAEAGYEAVAPIDSPFWTQKMSERYGLSSTWSERHAAFASGLGTFGLCDGLITPVGKAMRLRLRGGTHPDTAIRKALQGSPGLLLVLLQGHLRQMRGSLSCRCHQQGKGARQRKVQGLCFGHDKGVRCLPFRV